MVLSEFRPSEVEGKVLAKIKDDTSSGIKMARPIIARFIDYTENQLFSLDDPVTLRNEIFGFYSEQAERYDEIRNQHVMPIKKMLEFLQEKSAGENSLNMRMVRDTVKPAYFQNDIVESYRIDELDNKILNSRELKILRNKFDGKTRFIIELFLETTAKIGVIAALSHKDFPQSRTDDYRINLRNQYSETDGLTSLNESRNRAVEISEDLATLYFKNFEKNSQGYLFGENPKKAHSYLRNEFRKINQDIEFKVNPHVLRDTGAYIKLDSREHSDLREKMGVKTDSRIEKYEKVRAKREK